MVWAETDPRKNELANPMMTTLIRSDVTNSLVALNLFPHAFD